MYVCTCVCMYVSLSPYISLVFSLSLYIYIYIHTYATRQGPRGGQADAGRADVHRGQRRNKALKFHETN